MHIQLSSDELKKLDVSSFPDGTAIVELDTEGYKPIKSYSVFSGNLDLVEDFVENDRAWLPGEEEKFIDGKSKEDVLKFFLEHDDNGPHREWRAMASLERDYFNFIRHSGMYTLDDSGNRYNYFELKINRDSDFAEAAVEIEWALNIIADSHKDINPIELKVSEHTLSEFGTYSVLWNRKKTFELCKTTYGAPHVLKKIVSLKNLVEYVAKNHYYE